MDDYLISLMKQFDKDNNGYIDFRELAIGCRE